MERWRKAATGGDLADEVVHVWRAELDCADRGWLAALLSSDERERAAGIAAEHARLRWIAARGLLRSLLGEYLARDPGSLEFETGAQGKPALAGAPIEFNLSHSGSLALYAVALGNPVGVDVEQRRGAKLTPAALRRALGDSYDASVEDLPTAERERELARAWVCYEARVKCDGGGILRGAGADASLWLCELDLGAGAAAALAAAQAPREVVRLQLV